MTESLQKVWVQLRAELIVEWHNLHNPNKFRGGFSFNSAIEIAEQQLEYDLIVGDPRISLEDMLLKTDAECHEILRQKQLDKIKELLKAEHDVK
jgi:hypothetical protein